MDKSISVYGAGLAGCEAAWQAARRGIKVRLYEMKPQKYTPAHHSDKLAELVCSNSLRSDSVTNAVGLLKEELRNLGSLIMEAADATRVPAGSALAVDRDKFSSYITDKISNDPNITVIAREVTEIEDDGITVIATGPLTSDKFAEYISRELVGEGLHFFDAAAPIVDADSINMDIAFFASRYDKGDADYINCPMNEEQYNAFWQALVEAEEAELKEFDREEQKKLKVFEGCMPVEVMAKRGEQTLTFGPLKPVGLPNPKTGEEYHAVVQLRCENKEDTLYNLVGFQTNLTFPEQKRVFSLIPGLENAEFVRYGVMHRNTYINSPKHLNPTNALKNDENIFFAGQITGVEGYVESMASGIVAGINALKRFKGEEMITFPRETALGSLLAYITDGSITNFQPMNMNFGILPKLSQRIKNKKERYEKVSVIALEKMSKFIKEKEM